MAGIPQTASVREISRVITAIALVFIVPIFIAVSLPIFFIRYLTQKLAKEVKPDLVEMLSPSSSFFAQNDPLDDPRSSTVCQSTYEGQFGADEVIEAFQERLLDFKDSNGVYPFAKLTQCIVDWMGFKFWKEDENFDIRNHIKVHPEVKDKCGISEEDVTQLSGAAVSLPYDKKRSPWEMLVIPSVAVETSPGRFHTAVIWRLSHTLADGYSLIKLLAKLHETAKSLPRVRADPRFSKPSLLHRLSSLPNFLYKLAEVLLLSLEDTLWKVSPSKVSGEFHVVSAKVMECLTVKQAKNRHGVTFTSVVYSSVAAAIRNLSLQKGIKICEGETMPLLIPIPKPRHPGGLVNHFTMTLLDLPVGQPDSIQRLVMCNAACDKLKTSITPFVTGMLNTLFGSYCNFIGKHFKNSFSGCLVSYMPIGFNNLDFSLNGRKTLSMCFYCGVHQGTSAISIGLCGLGEDIRATVVADKAVFSKKEASLLLEMISEETRILAQNK